MKINLLELSILFVLFVCLFADDSSSTDESLSSSLEGTGDVNGEYSDLFTSEEYKKMKKKRVRKEIRDLNDEEWSRIANAMNTMKYIPDDVGQQYFGDKYINYDSLVCQHSRANMHRGGDMAHIGPHFNLWHRAFILAFENSLISIDKKIEAVPYWDFRRDIIEQNDTVNLSQSIIFSDQYFGDYSTLNDPDRNYAVKNGKFAFWPINDDPSQLRYECGDFYQNAFGLLRQRDNIEGNPYVTRFGGTLGGFNDFDIGSIEVYDDCLQSTTDYIEFDLCYNFNVHARAHIGIGGSRPAFIGQTSQSFPFCIWWHGSAWTKQVNNIRKWAHQYGCFDCPTPGSCIYDANDIDAAFECAMCSLTDDNTLCDIEGVYTLEILGERDEQQVIGDFVDQSTAPNDPLFMFHHVNIDRYLMEWQLRNYEQAPYYNYPTSGYEYGVHLDDVISDEAPFTNLFDDDDDDLNIGDGPYTFKDIWDGTTFVDAPYVYDTVLDLIKKSKK